ncbi:hypothetical protein Ancab_001607 [Ancistrocladus abbreviatus]
MAFVVPNLSFLPHPILQHSKSVEKLPLAPPSPTLTPTTLSTLQLTTDSATLSSHTKPKPTGARVKESTPSGSQDNEQKKNDFYLNLGLAVRTLREDLPQLFAKDINYDIYRILFQEIDLEVLRVWQPSENMILIRWNLRGIPRVPWEAKGQFQGTSRYKLDRNGKIYEHKVDNLAFNFPQPLKPPVSVLDLVTATPVSPNLTCFWAAVEAYSSSWVEFYRVVMGTLDQRDQRYLQLQDGLVIY